MKVEDLKTVFESFKPEMVGEKEELMRERGKCRRAIRLCDFGMDSCFLVHVFEEQTGSASLGVLLKGHGDFDCKEPLTCFFLKLPSGITATAHYKLTSGAFAVIAAVMSRIAKIAHPEVYNRLTKPF